MDKSWFEKLFSRPQKAELPGIVPQSDCGDAEVQFHTGLKFANGEGATQDYAQAAVWYLKAAEQNHSLAQFNLGIMYAQGQGMTRNDAQSEVWFGKAAQQGDAGAQFNLGKCRHRASLREQPEAARESRIEAYMWYQLAAAQGYKGSDAASTTLTLSMTREDVAAGDQRVAAFTAEKPARAAQ